MRLEKNERENVDVVAVGKYAARHGGKIGVSVIKRFDNISEDIKVAETEELCDFAINSFLAGKYKKVFVSYANFVSAFKRRQAFLVSNFIFCHPLVNGGCVFFYLDFSIFRHWVGKIKKKLTCIVK